MSRRPEAAAPATIRTNPDGTAFRFDPATLQRISRELAIDIGPIADVVVKRAVSGRSSTLDLCHKVAEEIESPEQREKFLRRVSASTVSGPVRAVAVEMPQAARIPCRTKGRTQSRTLRASDGNANNQGEILLVGSHPGRGDSSRGRRCVGPTYPRNRKVRFAGYDA